MGKTTIRRILQSLMANRLQDIYVRVTLTFSSPNYVVLKTLIISHFTFSQIITRVIILINLGPCCCLVCGNLPHTSNCILKNENLNKKFIKCRGKHLWIQAHCNQMPNIPHSDIIKITDQSSKPGKLNYNAINANVLKANTAQMQLPQNQPDGSAETMKYFYMTF